MRIPLRRALVLALALCTLVPLLDPPKAEARFGRVFRRIGRVVSRVVRRVTRPVVRVVRRITRPISRVVRRVVRVVRRITKPIAKVVKKAVKVVKKVAKTVGKALNKVIKVAGKVWKTVTDVVKGLGNCIRKLNFKCVWDVLKEKLLEPVKDFFKKMIEKGKAALKKLVEKAKKALGKIFQEKVIMPALKWALEAIFGKDAMEKVRAFVQRIIGHAEKVAKRQEEFAAVMQALADNDLDAYKTSMAAFEKGLTEWTEIKLVDIVAKLVDYAKERLLQFIKSKTVDLLDKAYTLVEAPIEAGKAAALAAISSIPFVGGIISGAADVVITMGLKALRKMGFEWVANKAAELAGKFIDKTIKPFLLKGAAKVEAKIKPILDKIKPYLQKGLELVGVVKEKWNLLRDKLRKAGEVLAARVAAAGKK